MQISRISGKIQPEPQTIIMQDYANFDHPARKIPADNMSEFASTVQAINLPILLFNLTTIGYH
jgi:hypothetical protein